ncbi:hypothetical protein N658DRAFT_527059 [Parathielavia hyrcaniae]|uniref:DUF6987 domain-containing protein n=1 Tax=Parathielavia hyrcaniae TaxID=113614 RepID=A0AAN6SYD8_9PEZI|nr:hypothetical protein N658DRAFT_527059 [Parathielavia hyrcaniae]
MAPEADPDYNTNPGRGGQSDTNEAPTQDKTHHQDDAPDRPKSPAYVAAIPKIGSIPPISPGIPIPLSARPQLPSPVASLLVGKLVDEDGDIVDDKTGQVLAHAAGDLPSMAGRRVSNARGDILGDAGELLGYVADIEWPTGTGTGAGGGPGAPRSLFDLMGRARSSLMVDHTGNILDAEGNVVGTFHDNNNPLHRREKEEREARERVQSRGQGVEQQQQQQPKAHAGDGDEQRSSPPPPLTPSPHKHEQEQSQFPPQSQPQHQPQPQPPTDGGEGTGSQPRPQRRTDEERLQNAEAWRKEKPGESPSDIFLDVKSTREGIQLTIRIPTVFNNDIQYDDTQYPSPIPHLKPTSTSPVAADKTPQGAWPSHHCESGEGAHGQSAATPRSQPAVPEYKGSNNGGNPAQEEPQSGEYTHQDAQAKAQDGVKGKGLDDDGQQQPIQMKDVEPEPVDETVQGKEDVEEKKEDATKNVDAAPDAEKNLPEGGEEPESKTDKAAANDMQAPEQTGTAPSEADTNASLTEKAKEAFDQASENRPTTEARDQFLEAARQGMDAPGTADRAASSAGQEVEQRQQQATSEVGAPQKTDAEPLEKPDVEAPEQPEVDALEKTDVEGAAKTAGLTDKAPTEQAQDEQQPQQTSEVEAPEKTDAEAQKAPTEQAEDVAADQEEAILDTQQKPAETEQQAAPEEAEAAGAEPQTQEQQDASQEPEAVEGEPTAAKDEPATEDAPADQQDEANENSEPKLDFSVLKSGTVNKGGNVVSLDKKIVGRVVSGALTHLIGKKVDENGDIWSTSGKVIGKAEPIPDSERDEMFKEPAPFESFPDAVVDKDGQVVNGKGEIIGRVLDGDKAVLRGKSVDPDGDILDRGGNVIGKAERWEPEPEKEPEPEPEVDKSALAGKRVNKAGNVVDGTGVIFGRVVEGDVKRMIGRMCDKKGSILSESGDVLGKAELVPEGEREGLKEGPFAELQGCTVAKDGTIVTPSGDVVGRLTSGDGKVLFGRTVDEDGDILDKNGNVVGRAERWEPEKAPERKKNPMSGRKVNREGNVVDEDGNVVGKLTSGDLTICSGKEIDDDGDVVDYKGNTIGHCSLLEDIPVEEPKEEESPEEKEKREQAERDKKVAVQMSVCIEQCLESIRPICKMITEKIERAERTPEDERDEEALVQEVRPLIEEGGRILNEAKGVIKGLDPDGRLAANAKHKTAAREATPEEYHLADVLKDLTGDVTQCIDNAKKKLEGMPHAKKELNPLWGLLSEPLFQILAAVGLLLAGVLNLVGRLLSGLGLGGLIDGLLGTLGLNRVLDGLGLGGLTKGLKGGKQGGGGGGGLLGGLLGGK